MLSWELMVLILFSFLFGSKNSILKDVMAPGTPKVSEPNSDTFY